MMITSEFKDADGFELQFDEKCPESDKKYFIKQFPKVDGIAGKRVHCTTCDTHIGTAPISEKIVRTHLILAVTQCNKCFAFYVRTLEALKDFPSFHEFSFNFRILASSGKAKTAASITVAGVAKAVKSFAAHHVLMCSATNASETTFLSLMKKKSRRPTTGRASFATRRS